MLPEDCDGALIINPVNRVFFTDFDASDGFLLITRKGSIFYTDSRYIEAAENKISCCEIQEAKDIWKQISLYLKSKKAVNIAVEASYVTLTQFTVLRKNPNLKAFDFTFAGFLDRAIEELRSVKNTLETENIKSAQSVAENGFKHILNYIKQGKTEREIRLELDFYMLSHGAEALSFDTIVASGKNSSMPHAVPTDKKIENGDFITMDFGAVVKGYHSDMTRTVCVGSATNEQIAVYNTVLKAQTAALKTLRAGLSCYDGDKAARDVIKNAGYGDYFGHSTGHGVGLEIHEQPSLSPKSKQILKTGNIVTVEPGIYLPGKFGVRIEDMALITDDGCINLTQADKSLIII